ncbi:hypothetical protein ACLMJK_004685, partial [Lecanora helva]
MGLDIPNIRAIIHVDLPYNLESYSQETGRAGRDNKVSEAFLLISKSSSNRPIPDLTRSISEDFGNNLLLRYISSTCRRAILNSYFDGVEKEKYGNSIIPCDFCNPDFEVIPEDIRAPGSEKEVEEEEEEFFEEEKPSILPENLDIEELRGKELEFSEISERKRQKNQAEALDFELIATLLRRYPVFCPGYLSSFPISETRHSVSECSKNYLGKSDFIADFEQYKAGIKASRAFEKYSG